MRSSLTEAQIAALRELSSIWKRESLVLIGASALGLAIDMRWRGTYDLDLSVSISIDDYPGRLSDLDGWKRSAGREHEWTSPHRVRVDLLPAGPEQLEAGEIVWPESGIRTSLIGMRLAFEHAEVVRISQDLDFLVAPVPVLAVLKAVAYIESPAERRKDLQDLAYLLESHGADDERRWSEEIVAGGLEFEDVGAFLLGRDIGSIIDDRERSHVQSLLEMAQGNLDSGVTQARLQALGPSAWRDDPERCSEGWPHSRKGWVQRKVASVNIYCYNLSTGKSPRNEAFQGGNHEQ